MSIIFIVALVGSCTRHKFWIRLKSRFTSAEIAYFKYVLYYVKWLSVFMQCLNPEYMVRFNNLEAMNIHQDACFIFHAIKVPKLSLFQTSKVPPLEIIDKNTYLNAPNVVKKPMRPSAYHWLNLGCLELLHTPFLMFCKHAHVYLNPENN